MVELVDEDRVKIFKDNTRDCGILIKRGREKRRKRSMTNGDFLNYMPIYKNEVIQQNISKKQSNYANMHAERIIHKENYVYTNMAHWVNYIFHVTYLK